MLKLELDLELVDTENAFFFFLRSLPSRTASKDFKNK